jgi:hypothetical protein
VLYLDVIDVKEQSPRVALPEGAAAIPIRFWLEVISRAASAKMAGVACGFLGQGFGGYRRAFLCSMPILIARRCGSRAKSSRKSKDWT